jgi:hypothetical protein
VVIVKTTALLALATSLLAMAQATEYPAAAMAGTPNAPIATVTKELYLPSVKGQCTYLHIRYAGAGLEREERQWIQAEETSPAARAKGVEGRLFDYKSRRSPDNGRTWSPFTSLPPPRTEDKHAVVYWGAERAFFYDPTTQTSVSMWLRQTQDGTCWYYAHTFARSSRDGGRTWNQGTLLRYEDGDDFAPNDPFKKAFLLHNQAYFGSNIIRHSNGTLIHCVGHANKPGTRETLGSLCFIGTWDPKSLDYRWKPGAPVVAEKRDANREFDEPCVAELRDGRVLVVWRRGSTPNESIRKWFSVSSDGGQTLTPPAEWKYDDGSRFYSPSSYHLMLRHSITGKLYWIGNIAAGPHASGECQPRFPLIIAEIDEAVPAIKRNTVTIIDNRAEGESDMIQLSNFSILENRETHAIELYMNRLGADPKNFWTGDSYKYTLTLQAASAPSK